MTTDPIAELGQKLVDDLAVANGIRNAPDKAMALFSGIPVRDDIVQAGRINPLVMGVFLANHFDYALVLHPAEAVVTALPGGRTATSWYSQILDTAEPTDPTSPTGQAAAAELLKAREAYGVLGAGEPLACDPPDWVRADAPYWQSWDSDHTTTSTSNNPDDPLQSSPFHIQPGSLWTIRNAFSTQDAVASPLLEQPQLLAQAVHSPALSIAGLAGLGAITANTARIADADITLEGDDQSPVRQRLRLLNPSTLRGIFIPPPPEPPTVVVTQTEHIHLRFEYTTVSLSRTVAGQSYWDDTLLNLPGWYVPGLDQGQLTPNGNQTVTALPYAVIVARNCVVDGTWSDQTRNALNAPGAAMGPIRLQTSTGGDTATVRYAGLQVIGLLATVLAILPPDNNPSPQAPPAARTYTVVKGDTLWTIALKAYGDGHRYTDIATANDITDPNRIDVGQQLTLP